MLDAIGHPGTSGFRLSLGPASTDADVEALLAELPSVVNELRDVERTSSEALSRFRPPQAG